MRTIIFGMIFVIMLAFNIATVAFTSVAFLVSTAYETVTGAASVAGSLRRNLGAEKAKVASMSNLVDELKKPRTVTYRGQKKLISEAVEDTATRVSRRTTAAAARNAGGVLAEVVPIAGVAAIVGITAWDLKDSCATLKDLHELEVAFDPSLAADPEVTEVCGLEVPSKEEIVKAVRAAPAGAWEALKSSPGYAWEGTKAGAEHLRGWVGWGDEEE